MKQESKQLKLFPGMHRIRHLVRVISSSTPPKFASTQSQATKILSQARFPVQLGVSRMSTEGSKPDEQALAQTAQPSESTIFDKIINKEIPATVVYEDDKCLAFRDVNPTAPVHVLVIPKVRGNLARLSLAQEEDKEILGHLMYTAKVVAEQEGMSKDGFRIVINDGPNGCQSVYHLHLHVIGGRALSWPPG